MAIADLLLAPFKPSNTSRSAGTVFPAIPNLPALYDRHPNDPSARRIGGYLIWVAIAAKSLSRSMFLTGRAPDLLAVKMVTQTAKIAITWTDWFVAFARVGLRPGWYRAGAGRVPVLSAAGEKRRRGAGLRPCGTGEAGAPQAARGPTGGPRAACARAVDLWRRRNQHDDGRDGRDRADGDPARGKLGRHPRQQAGMEHARVVRHAGGARRWSEQGRLRQVVRRCDRCPDDRRVPDAGRPRQPCTLRTFAPRAAVLSLLQKRHRGKRLLLLVGLRAPSDEIAELKG